MRYMYRFPINDTSAIAIADADEIHQFIKTILGHLAFYTLELSCGAR